MIRITGHTVPQFQMFLVERRLDALPLCDFKGLNPLAVQFLPLKDEGSFARGGIIMCPPMRCQGMRA